MKYTSGDVKETRKRERESQHVQFFFRLLENGIRVFAPIRADFYVCSMIKLDE